MREVELTRSIKHSNVVEIIDFELRGDADIVINTISHVYILFPFFKNGSLQDHLNMRAKTKDHMAESQVLQIFVGICEGIKALHEAKPEPLAHRDLKTGTIFLYISVFLIIFTFYHSFYHLSTIFILFNLIISMFVFSKYLLVRFNGAYYS